MTKSLEAFVMSCPKTSLPPHNPSGVFDCNFLLKERRKYLAYVEQLNQIYAHKTMSEN